MIYWPGAGQWSWIMKFLKWSPFFLLLSNTVFVKAESEDQKTLGDKSEESGNVFGDHKDIFKATSLSLYGPQGDEKYDVKHFLKIIRKKNHSKFPLLESITLWEGVGLEVLYKASMPKLRSIGFQVDPVHNFNKFFKLKEKNQIRSVHFGRCDIKGKNVKEGLQMPRLTSISASNITVHDLTLFKGLKAPVKEVVIDQGLVKSIDGIEAFQESLHSFSITRCDIFDIKALFKAQWPFLKELHFASLGSVRGLSDLRKLKAPVLEVLGLNFLRISDISFLKEMDLSSLKVLDLSENMLKDLSFLKKLKLPQLKELNLEGNFITNLKDLENLDAPLLKTVNLSANVGLSPQKVKDFRIKQKANNFRLKYKNTESGVSDQQSQDSSHFIVHNASDVQKLIKMQNQVQTLEIVNLDLQWLSGLNLIALTHLTLRFSGAVVEDLSSLADLKAPLLETLSIEDVDLRELKPVKAFNFPVLTELRIRNSRISDPEFFTHFKNVPVEDIYIVKSFCQDLNLQPIKQTLKEIQFQYCKFNQKNLRKQLEVLSLKSFHITHCGLKNLQFLNNMDCSKLENLSIHEWDIYDISAFKKLELPVLKYLNLEFPLIKNSTIQGQVHAPLLTQITANNKNLLKKSKK